MKKYEIRPAIASDFDAVYRRQNHVSVRAFTVLRDGEPVAIAGITIEKGQFIAFSDIKEGVTAPKMTIWRIAKKLTDLVKSFNIPAITTPCHTGKFLQSIGLEYMGECQEGEIYRI